MPTSRLSLHAFVGYTAAALGLLALFALGWKLREILMLAFGAVVVAAIFRAAARPWTRRHPNREKLAVGAAILAILVSLGGLFWLFGHQVSEQMRNLSERLPQAVESGRKRLEQHPAGRLVLEKLNPSSQKTEPPPAAATTGDTVRKTAMLTMQSIGHALLVLVAGIYLALQPQPYVRNAVRLFPLAHRPRVNRALLAAGDSLQRWLLGQLISMATIGTLTALGLWIVKCPVPLALGILAGLLVFVPVIGFILSFVPTMLIALSEGPKVALASLFVFIVVQQLEEQVVLPLAQRWATSLPPALGLFSLAASSALFGLPGVIFGVPLTVVALCLVKKLYLEPLESK